MSLRRVQNQIVASRLALTANNTPPPLKTTLHLNNLKQLPRKLPNPLPATILPPPDHP